MPFLLILFLVFAPLFVLLLVAERVLRNWRS